MSIANFLQKLFTIFSKSSILPLLWCKSSRETIINIRRIQNEEEIIKYYFVFKDNNLDFLSKKNLKFEYNIEQFENISELTGDLEHYWYTESNIKDLNDLRKKHFNGHYYIKNKDKVTDAYMALVNIKFTEDDNLVYEHKEYCIAYEYDGDYYISNETRFYNLKEALEIHYDSLTER